MIRRPRPSSIFDRQIKYEISGRERNQRRRKRSIFMVTDHAIEYLMYMDLIRARTWN